MFITYMYEKNINTNNSKLSQWVPTNGYESNLFSTKVRRTYGWLCPCGNYEANRRFNIHVNIRNATKFSNRINVETSGPLVSGS
jgi:hypothetical protein